MDVKSLVGLGNCGKETTYFHAANGFVVAINSILERVHTSHFFTELGGLIFRSVSEDLHLNREYIFEDPIEYLLW